MLNAAGGAFRRAPRSLRAEYEQFIEQRIEEYKDSLPRADILGIGDEAIQELAGDDQLQLTEVVLRDQVDAIIRKRLRLPSFRRWREKFVALRAAQAQPGHWGLSSHEPVCALVEVLEDQDPVLVVGASDGACALYLAAHGARVHVADPDIAAVYGLESRTLSEQLGAQIECEVAHLERYSPAGVSYIACVIETAVLAALAASDRAALIERLKASTPEGGRHAVMPCSAQDGREAHLASDALLSHYTDWEVVRVPSPPGVRKPHNLGFSAFRPVTASH